MKIGIDIRAITKESAGIGYYTAGFVQALTQQNDSKNDSSEDQYFLYANLTQQELETILGLVFPQNFQVKTYISHEVKWYLQVYQDVRREKIEVFYSPHSTLFSFFPKVKTVLMVHDLSAILFPQMHTRKVRLFAGKWFLTRACRRSAFIVVPSQATKHDLEKIIPESRGKIEVIYNGFWQEKKNKQDPNRFASWKFPYLLYVGTIEPRKNLVRLITAYSQFTSRDFPDLKLVIAGKKGWYYSEVFEKVQELHLEKQIIFTGYVNAREKRVLFSRATAFVFPSLYEGFGLPVLEALRFGLLVLTSKISALPEVVGKSYPFLVDPTDIKDIANKLRALCQLDKKQKQALNLKLQKRSEQFTWTNHVRTWRQKISLILKEES